MWFEELWNSFLTSLGEHLVGNIFAFVGLVLSFVIFQQKSRGNLLIWKFIADIAWCLSYLFLEAYSGLAICIIALARSVVFYFRDKKKWAAWKGWPVVFICIAIASTALTWHGTISLLTCAASIIAIISFWIGIPQISRYMGIPVSALMFTYDAFVFSYMGLVNETFTVISCIIGTVRYYAAKKKEKAEAETEETNE